MLDEVPLRGEKNRVKHFRQRVQLVTFELKGCRRYEQRSAPGELGPGHEVLHKAEQLGSLLAIAAAVKPGVVSFVHNDHVPINRGDLPSSFILPGSPSV